MSEQQGGTCGFEWNTEMEDPDSWLTDHVCELAAGHDGAHECRCGKDRGRSNAE